MTALPANYLLSPGTLQSLLADVSSHQIMQVRPFTIIFVFILTAPSSSYGRNLKVEVGFSPGVQDFKSINIIFIFKLLFIN